MTNMCSLQEEYGGRGAFLLLVVPLESVQLASARARNSSKEAFGGCIRDHRYSGGEIDRQRSLCGE
jgi:hypothetical protein